MTAVTVESRRIAGANRSMAIDMPLLLAALGLVAIGIVFVTSASIALAERETGNMLYFAEKQVMYAGLGMVVAVFMMSVPTAFWQKLSPVSLLGAFGMLSCRVSGMK